jgi:hypothetical protein
VVSIHCAVLLFLPPLLQGDSVRGWEQCRAADHPPGVVAVSSKRLSPFSVLVGFETVTSVRGNPVKGETTWVFRSSGDLGSTVARSYG